MPVAQISLFRCFHSYAIYPVPWSIIWLPYFVEYGGQFFKYEVTEGFEHSCRNKVLSLFFYLIFALIVPSSPLLFLLCLELPELLLVEFQTYTSKSLLKWSFLRSVFYSSDMIFLPLASSITPLYLFFTPPSPSAILKSFLYSFLLTACSASSAFFL